MKEKPLRRLVRSGARGRADRVETDVVDVRAVGDVRAVRPKNETDESVSAEKVFEVENFRAPLRLGSVVERFVGRLSRSDAAFGKAPRERLPISAAVR